jgi:hypothetical protein
MKTLLLLFIVSGFGSGFYQESDRPPGRGDGRNQQENQTKQCIAPTAGQLRDEITNQYGLCGAGAASLPK